MVKLYKEPATVFTSKDLALIWRESNLNNLKSKVNYYVKKGYLIRLGKGIFARDNNYSIKELANSVYKPSYISFETVLREKGVIFQHYENIFVACRWSRERKIGKIKIQFRKLKDEILYSPEGIEFRTGYSIASLERAFLDTIYLMPDHYFDNLSPINWDKCFELVKLYNNKKLEKRLNNYYKNYVK